MESHEAVIVGGGPAGLGAARRLVELGICDVVVLEREAEAGGIPRHCGHWGFGWQSHRRLWTGPRFAAELRRTTAGIDVRNATSVLELRNGGYLRIQNNFGVSEIKAKRILLATGARETPRAPRFIGGSRPQGVMNTGTLQQHVYLYGNKPFERPVIIGSEWVSFSALMTCRHAGIQPVAMLEENDHIDAPPVFSLGASLVFRVPVHKQCKLIAIHGRKIVEAVEVMNRGRRSTISCDGVVITGKFRAESALYAGGLLERDGDAPRIAENFRTSDPSVYAAGNVLPPLKTSGDCVAQGHAVAAAIFGDWA